LKTEPRVEFAVDLRPLDLYWFYFTHAISREAVARRYLGVALLLLVLLFGERLESLSSVLGPNLPYVFIGAFVYSFLIWPYLAARSKVHAALGAATSIKYTLTDLGIDALSSGASTHTDWVKVQKAKQTSALFLLHHASGTVTILPKRCLSTPQALSTCREFAGATRNEQSLGSETEFADVKRKRPASSPAFSLLRVITSLFHFQQ
jgi:hypothetical protein